MKKIFLAVLLFLPSIVFGQDDFNLRMFDQLPQTNWVNAASKPQNTISIGLPLTSSFALGTYNTGFTYHDVVGHSGDTAVIRLGNLVDVLGKRNYLGFGAHVNVFNFYYTSEKFMVGFSVQDKMRFQFTYPGDLFRLIWNGNGTYLGEPLEIGGFGLDINYYREYALHFNTGYKKWRFGVSPKFLMGKIDIYTKDASVQLLTDPAYYELTLTSRMDIRTSGLPDSSDLAGNNYQWQDVVFANKNLGFGLDAAAQYKWNDHLTLSGGINDLGYIKWKNMIHNYTSPETEVKFDGVHLEDMYQDGELNYSGYLDSVVNKFQLQQNNTPYSTPLPMQFFLTGTYDFYKNHRGGILLYANSFNKKVLPAATLSYRFSYTKHFSVGVSYTAKSHSYDNLGFGMMLQFLGMQSYISTDNVLGFIRPLDTHGTNIHFGSNIVFGLKKKKEEPKKL